DGTAPYGRLYSMTSGPSSNRRLTMRRAIRTLAGSAALGVLALTGLQGVAQAHEYRHHEIRYYHRDHDHRYHSWYWHYRYDRHHLRRLRAATRGQGPLCPPRRSSHRSSRLRDGNTASWLMILDVRTLSRVWSTCRAHRVDRQG